MKSYAVIDYINVHAMIIDHHNQVLAIAHATEGDSKDCQLVYNIIISYVTSWQEPIVTFFMSKE